MTYFAKIRLLVDLRPSIIEILGRGFGPMAYRSGLYVPQVGPALWLRLGRGQNPVRTPARAPDPVHEVPQVILASGMFLARLRDAFLTGPGWGPGAKGSYP